LQKIGHLLRGGGLSLRKFKRTNQLAMTVQAFIGSQEHPVREIMTIMRSWILDLGAHSQEKITNRTPYFYFYGVLCSLNKRKGNGVELSFLKGNILDDENKILEANGRKQIRSKTFYSIAELEEVEDPIRHLLNEAAILNEYHFKQRQKKKVK
jgi:hypothetical protein